MIGVGLSKAFDNGLNRNSGLDQLTDVLFRVGRYWG
jgi:hypothetical protein